MSVLTTGSGVRIPPGVLFLLLKLLLTEDLLHRGEAWAGL